MQPEAGEAEILGKVGLEAVLAEVEQLRGVEHLARGFVRDFIDMYWRPEVVPEVEELRLDVQTEPMPQCHVGAEADRAVLVVVEFREHLRQCAIHGLKRLCRQSARPLAHQIRRERLRLAETHRGGLLAVAR